MHTNASVIQMIDQSIENLKPYKLSCDEKVLLFNFLVKTTESHVFQIKADTF